MSIFARKRDKKTKIIAVVVCCDVSRSFFERDKQFSIGFSIPVSFSMVTEKI